MEVKNLNVHYIIYRLNTVRETPVYFVQYILLRVLIKFSTPVTIYIQETIMRTMFFHREDDFSDTIFFRLIYYFVKPFPSNCSYMYIMSDNLICVK